MAVLSFFANKVPYLEVYSAEIKERMRDMKKIVMAIGISLLCMDVNAASYETNICIKNTSTKVTYELDVLSLQNSDWDGDSRPDKNIRGVSLLPGQNLCNREQVNSFANNPSFTVVVNNQSVLNNPESDRRD